jgi:hypothetical protein
LICLKLLLACSDPHCAVVFNLDLHQGSQGHRAALIYFSPIGAKLAAVACKTSPIGDVANRQICRLIAVMARLMKVAREYSALVPGIRAE